MATCQRPLSRCMLNCYHSVHWWWRLQNAQLGCCAQLRLSSVPTSFQDNRQFKHQTLFATHTQTQHNLIMNTNPMCRICHTPISHWLRNLGYVPYVAIYVWCLNCLMSCSGPFIGGVHYNVAATKCFCVLYIPQILILALLAENCAQIWAHVLWNQWA